MYFIDGGLDEGAQARLNDIIQRVAQESVKAPTLTRVITSKQPLVKPRSVQLVRMVASRHLHGQVFQSIAVAARIAYHEMRDVFIGTEIGNESSVLLLRA